MANASEITKTVEDVLEDIIMSGDPDRTGALVGEGDERTYARPVPVAVAREVERVLEAAGRKVSWAPDGDDRTLAWIYC